MRYKKGPDLNLPPPSSPLFVATPLFSLYRDDDLTLMRSENGQKRDRIRKEVIKIFKEIGFKIEIKTNFKVVDFLDITFNPFSGTYKPYRKPNDNLL